VSKKSMKIYYSFGVRMYQKSIPEKRIKLKTKIEK